MSKQLITVEPDPVVQGGLARVRYEVGDLPLPISLNVVIGDRKSSLLIMATDVASDGCAYFDLHVPDDCVEFVVTDNTGSSLNCRMFVVPRQPAQA